MHTFLYICSFVLSSLWGSLGDKHGSKTYFIRAELFCMFPSLVFTCLKISLAHLGYRNAIWILFLGHCEQSLVLIYLKYVEAVQIIITKNYKHYKYYFLTHKS